MEASGALSMGWKCKALSREGLRSPSRKVNSEGLCTPGDQPEKRERERERKRERKKEREKERERERMTQGDQVLMKPGLQLYSQKEPLCPELHISRSERHRVMQSQFNNTSIWTAYLFIYKGLCVLYIIFWPRGLLTFCDSFLIKVGKPVNLFSLKVCFFFFNSSNLLNNVILLWSKGAMGYNK